MGADKNINQLTDEFVEELNMFSEQMNAPVYIDHFGSIMKPRFTRKGKSFSAAAVVEQISMKILPNSPWRQTTSWWLPVSTCKPTAPFPAVN